jgi:hypothetical protein
MASLKNRSNLNKSSFQLPSDKKFGWFFCAFFLIAAGWFAWLSSLVWASILIAAAVVFAIITLASPSALRPLNHLWSGLGILLGKIISPIVLGSIFFFLITPVAFVTRLFGRDELKMRRRSVQSYWLARTPPGPPSESFKNQF